VLGWIAVLIGAILMLFFDLPILDPILSVLIAVYVLYNVYRNIMPAFRIILQGVPGGMNKAEIMQELLKDERITDVHDIRLWSLDGTHHIASLHVVARTNIDLKEAEKLKEEVKERLHKLHVLHATVEVEFNPDH